MAPSFIELDAIPLKMGINLQTSFYQKKKTTFGAAYVKKINIDAKISLLAIFLSLLHNHEKYQFLRNYV
jgi:hypothetical protein